MNDEGYGPGRCGTLDYQTPVMESARQEAERLDVTRKSQERPFKITRDMELCNACNGKGYKIILEYIEYKIADCTVCHKKGYVKAKGRK